MNTVITFENVIVMEFEILGALVCAVFGLLLMRRSDFKRKPVKIAFIFIVAIAVVLISDVVSYVFRGAQDPEEIIALRLGNLFTFVFSFVAFITYTSYIYRYVPKTHMNETLRNLSQFISVLGIIEVVVSQYSDFLYYFDENNIYHRGDMAWTIYLITALAMIVDLILIFKNFKSMSKYIQFRLLSFVAIYFLMGFIQLFVYGYSLTGVGFVIYVFSLGISTLRHKEVILTRQESEISRANDDISHLKLQVIMSQMQPHFMFNALNAIYYLCGKDSKKAQESIAIFSDYLRTNLNALQAEEPIPFKDELKHIQNYLKLEKVRYDDFLEYEFDIEREDFIVPPLSIQSIVEAAIRYGISNNPRGGWVKVSTTADLEEYIVTVEDNREKPNNIDDYEHADDMFPIFNDRLQKVGGTFELHTSPEGGAIATVRFPIEKVEIKR